MFQTSSGAVSATLIHRLTTSSRDGVKANHCATFCIRGILVRSLSKFANVAATQSLV